MNEPEFIPVQVPDLGFNELPVRLGAWLIDVGDSIEAGDRLAELIVPGLVCEVTAPVSGTLRGLECATGAQVQPGQILCQIEPSDPADEAIGPA